MHATVLLLPHDVGQSHNIHTKPRRHFVYLYGLTWSIKGRMPGSNIPLSLIPSHRHLANFQGWRRDPAAHVEIIADHLNVRQHLT